MYPKAATIEIFRQGHWQPAGQFRPDKPEQGYRGSSQFEYLLDYAVENAAAERSSQSGLSCRYPAGFDLHREEHWPAFLLDLLPSGYGRTQWVEQLELPDGPAADWPLLLRGCAFPVGNLRIAEAVAAKNPARPVPSGAGQLIAANEHPGFTRDEVAARNEHFVEYAFQLGIYAAGGSDVQGVAPKMLLTEDGEGRWHAEGVLPDDRVKSHWLVKMPRGGTAADRHVLRNEAAYMKVAHVLGLDVQGLLQIENNSLFIPRFDRKVVAGSHIERYGMESLCSLAGVAEYGIPVSHDTLCRAILRFSSQPAIDLLEYIKRDVANVVMGNKDNHARNSAVLRHENGEVTLSPLFDFAPMYLDPEGIPRVCRWEGDTEQAGLPVWQRVAELYQEQAPGIAEQLKAFGAQVEQLPDLMKAAGVDDDIITGRAAIIEQNARELKAL